MILSSSEDKNEGEDEDKEEGGGNYNCDYLNLSTIFLAGFT